MKRFTWVWLFLLAGCGADDACYERVARASVASFVRTAEAAPDGEHIDIRYVDGFDAVVPIAPKRIVSTLPGLTEIVAHLGALDRLVGVSPHCDTPSAVRAVQQIGVMPLDFEAILALDADLVIVDRSLFRSRLGEMKQRFPSLLALETSRSLADLATSIDLLATVLDTPEASRAAGAWRVDLERIEARIARDAPAVPPRVLVVSLWDPLNVIGPGALIDDCLRICGCANIACDLRGPSGAFDEELIVARQPDWIFHRAHEVPPGIASRWSGVPGVAPGRIGPCETNDLSRGGPRILAALQRLAAVLRGRASIETLVPEPGE